MAVVAQPMAKKRKFWWQMENPPKCPKCGAAMVAYSSPAQSQYRKCSAGCKNVTSKNSRK